MRAFITVPLFLTAILALAIGISMLVGHSEPSPERIARLHLADCALPCWDGITPGVSSFVVAIKHFKSKFPDFVEAAPAFPFYSWEYNDVTQNDSYISFEIDNGTLAASVTIKTNYATTVTVLPSFGEMLAIFGTPSCIVSNQQTGKITLDYESSAHKSLMQFTAPQPLLSSSVTSIIYGTPIVYGGTSNFSCQQGTMTWQAFRRAQPTFYASGSAGYF